MAIKITEMAIKITEIMAKKILKVPSQGWSP